MARTKSAVPAIAGSASSPPPAPPRIDEESLFGLQLAELDLGLRYYRRLHKLRRYMTEGYANPDLSLQRAADIAGMSPNHLNRMFRRATGMTFMQFLNRYRILLAAELIGQRNYTAMEVARRTGYANDRTFARNFKRLVGVTPSAYRKLLRRYRAHRRGARLRPTVHRPV